MMESQILISDSDEKKLRGLIRGAERSDAEAISLVKKLEVALTRAAVLRSSKMPEDIVTMNSCVRLQDLDSTREEEVWLRFTSGRGTDSKSCPILSDLGVVLLGSREGDVVEWSGPSGKRRSKITEIVYQPERLGNYEL
jgi:regulator of nucleoside diphosphate kinase